MPVKIYPKSAYSVSGRTYSLFMFRYNALKNNLLGVLGVTEWR